MTTLRCLDKTWSRATKVPKLPSWPALARLTSSQQIYPLFTQPGCFLGHLGISVHFHTVRSSSFRTRNFDKPSQLLVLRSLRSRLSRSPQPPNAKQSPYNRSNARRLLVFFGTLTAGTLGFLYLCDPKGFDHNVIAVGRSYRAGVAAVSIVADYVWSLRKSQQADVVGEEEYKRIKSACHSRSAQRLLDLCKSNGGIYIKLGQHISALQYLLPEEYTETLKVLQDRCPPTPLDQIELLFQEDLGCSISDLFEEFDPKPVGVASLAQVHRARLRENVKHTLFSQELSHHHLQQQQLSMDSPATVSTSNATSSSSSSSGAVAPLPPPPHTMKGGAEVAIKIQHRYLDEYTPVDIHTCTTIVRLIKRFFPAFEFEWLATEMQLSLPKELDFVHEALNANQVRHNFRNNKVLKIPDVYWAKRRMLVMEYIHGAKIDDLNYMRKHTMDPRAVSAELNKVYSEMIFLHGWVHCDPHQGNVFVRPRPHPPSFWTRWFSPTFSLFSRFFGFNSASNPHNFELVLLDHGLYRNLPDDLRLDYAHLWAALIAGDEPGIERYSYRLFTYDDRVKNKRTADGIDYHRLFASMLTGRAWSTIAGDSSEDGESGRNDSRSGRSRGLASVRTDQETKTIINKAGSGAFFLAVSEVLAALPREVLLLLKTNDLLRSVDNTLGVGTSPTASSLSPSSQPAVAEEEDIVKAKQRTLHLIRMVTLMGWYCTQAIHKEKIKQLYREMQEKTTVEGNWVWLPVVWADVRFWRCWWEYWMDTVRLRVGVEVWVWVMGVLAQVGV
ncbi:hypothetical protein HK102_004976 [Quaeritorhiza haematococci]|nr:hypothetical protein HK102_004976 [Quaeritorhiza haematococci]